MTLFACIVVFSLYCRFTLNDQVDINNNVPHNEIIYSNMADFYDDDEDGMVDRFVDQDGNVFDINGNCIEKSVVEENVDGL